MNARPETAEQSTNDEVATFQRKLRGGGPRKPVSTYVRAQGHARNTCFNLASNDKVEVAVHKDRVHDGVELVLVRVPCMGDGGKGSIR